MNSKKGPATGAFFISIFLPCHVPGMGLFSSCHHCYLSTLRIRYTRRMAPTNATRMVSARGSFRDGA